MKRASAGEENLRVLIFRLAANERAYDMFNYKRTFFRLGDSGNSRTVSKCETDVFSSTSDDG